MGRSQHSVTYSPFEKCPILQGDRNEARAWRPMPWSTCVVPYSSDPLPQNLHSGHSLLHSIGSHNESSHTNTSLTSTALRRDTDDVKRWECMEPNGRGELYINQVVVAQAGFSAC